MTESWDVSDQWVTHKRNMTWQIQPGIYNLTSAMSVTTYSTESWTMITKQMDI